MLWCDLNRIRRHVALRRGLEYDSVACDVISKWIPQRLQDVVGPYSDENFDTYMHVPRPVKKRKNGMWKFLTLQPQLRTRRCNDFHMRKLMASLRAVTPQPFSWSKWLVGESDYAPPWASKSWGGARLKPGAGSVFDVTDKFSVTLSVSSHQTSVWSDEYNEPYPY